MLKKLFGQKDPFKEAVDLSTKEDRDEEKKVEGLKRLRDFVDSDALTQEKIDVTLKIFLDKSSSRDDDARAMAISGIGHLARKQLIPSNDICKILQLMTVKAEDKYDTTRCNAIWCINNLVENNLVPNDQIDEILTLMLNRLNDKHDDARSNAIWCIGKLALNNMIPDVKVDQVLGSMVSKAEDKYLLARINAVGCLSRLAGNNLISQLKAEKVLSRMISKSSDRNEAVRSNAIWCICCLAMNNLIPPNKVEQVILIMLTFSNSSVEDAKTKVVNCIFNIAQYNIIPSEVVDQVLTFMMKNGRDADDIIRYNAIWCICDLAENNLILPGRIEDVLILVMNAIEDRIDSVRCNAIRCISSLTENNAVPSTKTRMVFMLMIVHTNDENDDARAMSIICIGNLVKNNRIPLSKLERVLLLMLSKLEDPYDDARAVSMWCIGHLAKMNRIPASKMDDVMSLIISKSSDPHDGVRSNSLWCLAVLSEYNHIPQQWLEESLRAVIRKIKDPDVGVRVTACFCVSFLCRLTPCDIGLVGRCVTLLISLENNDDWKYRGIEALCAFTETNLMGLTEKVNNAIVSTNNLGEAFYDSIPSASRRAEVASRIKRALEVIEIKEPDHADSHVDNVSEVSVAYSGVSSGAGRPSNEAKPTSNPRSTSPQSATSGSSMKKSPILGDGGWNDKAAFDKWRTMRKSTSMKCIDEESPQIVKSEEKDVAPAIKESVTLLETKVAAPEKTALSIPETVSTTSSSKPLPLTSNNKNPGKQELSKNKMKEPKMTAEEAKRAAIESLRAKPLFQPVAPRKGISKAPSTRKTEPPPEWDESAAIQIPSLQVKGSTRTVSISKKTGQRILDRVQSLKDLKNGLSSLSMFDNSNSNNVASSEKKSGSVTKSFTSSSTRKSPSATTTALVTTKKTVAPKTPSVRSLPSKLSPALKAIPEKLKNIPELQMPRPSPAQRAMARAAEAASNVSSTSSSQSRASLVKTKSLTRVSSEPTNPSKPPNKSLKRLSSLDAGSLQQFMSEAHHDAEIPSHERILSNMNKNDIFQSEGSVLDKEASFTPSSTLTLDNTEAEDLSTDHDIDNSSQAIENNSRSSTLNSSVEGGSVDEDDNEIDMTRSLAVESTIPDIITADILPERYLTSIDEGTEIALDAASIIILDKELTEENDGTISGCTSPFTDRIQALDLLRNESSSYQFDESAISESKFQEKSMRESYFERSLKKDSSFMADDQSVISIDSYASSQLGRDLSDQNCDTSALYITPGILSGPLPSVKETITSFERMITKRSVSVSVGEESTDNLQRRKSDKKFREY